MSDFNVFYLVTQNELLGRGKQRVNITKPRILDIMLLENEQLISPRSLKYFRQPPSSDFPLNLNLGLEDYKFRTEEYFNFSPRKWEKYLMKNHGRSLLKDTGKQKFCTTRNVLKCIMMTPFRMGPNARNNWTVNVIKFQNVIYMNSEKKKRKTTTRFETYHCKLHQYCFSDSPYKKPETDEPIDENTQMSCIYRINVDDFQLLYSAEIVGVESMSEVTDFKNEPTLNKCRFVTTRILREKNRNYEWKKDPKLFGTWIQSYLASVDKVYVGFRTESGYVNRKLEQVKAQEIPKDQPWKPEVCKRFLRDFLAKVAQKMATVDCPYTVCKIIFDSKLKMMKYKVYEGKTEHSFLSNEFIQYMQKK